jgi:phosphatidylglycerophosphate synthase
MTEELDFATRVTGSVLGGLERPLLIRLAKAMPRWVTSDQLTLLGLVGAAICGAAYCLCNWDHRFLWLASAGLLLNWFGDSLDGTLARVRRKERPKYGFLVDHTADLGSQVLIGVGAGASPFVNFDLACLSLIVFLAFGVFSFMRTAVSEELQISYAGIGPTEVRCAIIVINCLLIWYHPVVLTTLWEPMTDIDLVVLVATVAEAIILVLAAFRELRRVSREEPGH